MELLDGWKVSQDIRKSLRRRVEDFEGTHGYFPCLGAILVGDDPSSEIYVNKKAEACDEVLMHSAIRHVDKEHQIINAINDFNEDESVHGYILQLPLPKNLDPNKFFDKINPWKDIDVLHPENVGLLVQGRPRFKPCTPHGIQIMLHRHGIQVAGQKVVVINRSNIVGKPLSSMLIQECSEYANATVTVCHDATPPVMLKDITRAADIIVVAVGKPGFLTADMVKQGVIIVDVGITRVGKKVLGDVDKSCFEVAKWVSPVPGGVGPMTVTMLLENTFQAAQYALQS
jgi:methylenetetrahydrofolate dehydrogenase (NADP+)/methenyltetrahydrofolate cyclohydrolase